MKTRDKKPKYNSNKEYQVQDGQRRKKLKQMPKQKFNWRLTQEEE